eukprot:scaffold20.g7684.t1
MILARTLAHAVGCHGQQVQWAANPATSRLIVTLWSCAARAARPPPHQAQARPHAWRSIAASAARPGLSASDKKRVVFLGTPERDPTTQVGALVLRRLMEAASQPDATFEVAAVVTQPGRPKGRGNKRVPQPSPVEVVAVEAGLGREQIFSPERATDKQFLESLAALAPDLCVTAAYGNYLPTRFLAIPPAGTLNIHPSLLPAYRGAAPVQRALQDGVAVTGVSVLYTVKEMDAGPILAQQAVEVEPDIQAPELLAQLFLLGTDLLLASLGAVWAGAGPAAARPQDAAGATHAAKLQREEAALDFARLPAAALHDQIRGFAGWPGSHHVFAVRSAEGGDEGELELKVLRTRPLPPEASPRAGSGGGDARAVAASRHGLYVRCGDGSVLQLLEVQAPGKRPMAAADFVNGLKGRTLHWQPLPAPAALTGAAA